MLRLLYSARSLVPSVLHCSYSTRRTSVPHYVVPTCLRASMPPSPCHASVPCGWFLYLKCCSLSTVLPLQQNTLRYACVPVYGISRLNLLSYASSFQIYVAHLAAISEKLYSQAHVCLH
ncbi:hypothetical protein S245_040066, partial [Arachis hypogaea]